MSSKDVDYRKVTAAGAGIDQAITGQPTSFIIQGIKGQMDKVHLEIDGPAQPSLNKKLDDDGNAIVTYTPPLPGEYKVSVQFNNKHVKSSPFKVEIIGESDPKLQKVSKIQVSGKGIAIGKAYMQNEFWIDGRDAHLTAGLVVNVKNPERASSQLKINDMGDGTFKCIYKPTASGLYIINIKVEGVHIPGSPFYVRVT